MSSSQAAGSPPLELGRHNRSLDGLRFFAFLSVFLAHTGTYYPITGYSTRVFFVLSGFLIGRILIKQKAQEGTLRDKLWTFYGRRTLRIFPLYYGVLIALVVLPHLGIHRFPDKALRWQFFYISNYYEYFVEMPGMSGHFWTLAIEEQFYLIVPLLFFTLSANRIKTLIVGLWSINLLLSLFNAFYWHDPQLRLFSNIQFGFIAMGLAAAYVQEHQSFLGARTKAIYGIGAGGVLGALVMVVLFRRKVIDGTNAYMLFEWLVAIGSMGVILALWRNKLGLIGKFLSLQPFVYLGQISYGLYVYHSFIFPLFGPKWGGDRVSKFIALLATIGVAALSWHLYEHPINELKRYFAYRPTGQPGTEPGNPILVPADTKVG